MKRYSEENSEYNSVPDNPVGTSADGVNTPEANTPPLRNDEVPENMQRPGREYLSDAQKKRLSKRGAAAKAGSALLTSVAALVVLSTTVLGGNTKLPSADITAVRVGDEEVGYTVVVDEGGLTLRLTNDFTARSYPLKKGTNVGLFEGLQPDMEYTLSVTKGKDIWDKKVLTEEKVRTGERGTELPLTRLNGVTSECRCAIDGCFYFTLDLTDENGFYSDFKAVMTDFRGNTRTLSFSDPHAQQKIYVRARPGEPFYGGSAHPVTLRITCSSMEHGDAEEIVLYHNAEILI